MSEHRPPSTRTLLIHLEILLDALRADLRIRQECTRPEIETDRDAHVVRIRFRWTGACGTYDVVLVHDAASFRLLELTRDHDVPPPSAWCPAGTCDRPKNHPPPHSQYGDAVYGDSLQALQAKLVKMPRPRAQIPQAMLDARLRERAADIVAAALVWGDDGLQEILEKAAT
jgi:hypothetical protein